MSGSDNGMTVEQWEQKIAGAFDRAPQMLIPALQFVQGEAGYLPKEAMTATARHLRVSEAKVYGVASFYAQFHFEPRGRNTVTVCRGTACHVRGSAKILQDLESFLGVRAGQTTPDLEFSLETVACFGSCALAPVVVINDRVHARQTSGAAKGTISGLQVVTSSDCEGALDIAETTSAS